MDKQPTLGQRMRAYRDRNSEGTTRNGDLRPLPVEKAAQRVPCSSASWIAWEADDYQPSPGLYRDRLAEMLTADEAPVGVADDAA